MADNDAALDARSKRVREWKRTTMNVAQDGDLTRWEMLYALVCADRGVVTGSDEHYIAHELSMFWGHLEQRLGETG